MNDKLVKDEEFPVRPGSVLPNTVGCILLAETVVRQYDHRRDSIVLAVNPGGATYQPFVTWLRVVSNDTPGEMQDYCYMGHYRRTLADAMTEYQERVDEKLDMIEQSGRLKAEAS